MKNLEYIVAFILVLIAFILFVNYTSKNKVVNDEYKIIINKLDSIQEVQTYLLERSWRQDEAILETQLLIKKNKR